LQRELKDKLENVLKTDNVYIQTQSNYHSHIDEIIAISRSMKINPNDLPAFIQSVVEKNEMDLKNEKHLKILYFNIISELERMTKVKDTIDKRATNRVSFYLTLLLLVLIAQTILFYHMIFNVDYLGWDLVEPTTFLFGSIVFILGIFSYVKFHKNAVSGEKMFHDFRKNILLNRYIRANFNMEKYNSLNNTLLVVKKMLSQSGKI
jgi:hypothetical protein